MKTDGEKLMWISVKDRLPEDNQTVLTIREFGDIRVCFFEKENGGEFRCNGGSMLIYDITHWLPIPEPPMPLVACYECKYSKPKQLGKYRECLRTSWTVWTVTPSDRCPFGKRKEE